MQRLVSGHAPSRVAAFGSRRPHFVTFVFFVNFVAKYVFVTFVAAEPSRKADVASADRDGGPQEQ